MTTTDPARTRRPRPVRSAPSRTALKFNKTKFLGLYAMIFTLMILVASISQGYDEITGDFSPLVGFNTLFTPVLDGLVSVAVILLVLTVLGATVFGCFKFGMTNWEGRKRHAVTICVTIVAVLILMGYIFSQDWISMPSLADFGVALATLVLIFAPPAIPAFWGAGKKAVKVVYPTIDPDNDPLDASITL